MYHFQFPFPNQNCPFFQWVVLTWPFLFPNPTCWPCAASHPTFLFPPARDKWCENSTKFQIWNILGESWQRLKNTNNFTSPIQILQLKSWVVNVHLPTQRPRGKMRKSSVFWLRRHFYERYQFSAIFASPKRLKELVECQCQESHPSRNDQNIIFTLTFTNSEEFLNHLTWAEIKTSCWRWISFWVSYEEIFVKWRNVQLPSTRIHKSPSPSHTLTSANTCNGGLQLTVCILNSIRFGLWKTGFCLNHSHICDICEFPNLFFSERLSRMHGWNEFKN